MLLEIKNNDVFVEIKYDELKNLITKATQRDILLDLIKDNKKYQKIKNAFDGTGNTKQKLK